MNVKRAIKADVNKPIKESYSTSVWMQTPRHKLTLHNAYIAKKKKEKKKKRKKKKVKTEFI